jgi:photosystem II stability/assembly factor-like uncharacterized protein
MLLDAATDEAIRAQFGSHCSGPRSGVALSDDGGTTWKAVHPPAPHVLRVRAVKAHHVWLVAADKSCTPAFYESKDSGKTWQRKASTSGAWHLLPGQSAAIHAPYHRSTPPCPSGSRPSLLSGVTFKTGVVACRGDDSTSTALLRTGDGGKTWQRVDGAPIGHLTAMSWPSAQDGFLLDRSSGGGCAGLQLHTSTDAGATWSSAGCLHVDTTNVAASFPSATRGMVVAATSDGAATYTTSDGGQHWSPTR